MAKNEIEIPEGVIDDEAYLEYIKKARHPLLTTKKMYECSDGTEINLASFPHIITKKIKHLPVKEQNTILTKKDLYSKINNKATALKRKAFGSKQGRVERHGGVLTTKREELIEYFGRMFTVDEMTKHINSEWGIPVKRGTVEKFRKEHAVEIERKVEVFKSSYSDIRLGVKRSRIEELVWLYAKAKEKYKDTLGREDYKILLTTLESIRKEAEGDRLTIDGKVDVNYEANIHLHLREEVFKTLNLKEIILGRVAARMNVNPVKLIYSLNQSFYKKFSNVLGDYDDENDGDITFPSQMNYNFEKIQKYHVHRDAEVQDAVVVEEEQNKKDVKKAQEKKETIADKIKRKREAMNKAKSDLNADTDIKGKNSKK
jgi:hypothetical protein